MRLASWSFSEEFQRRMARLARGRLVPCLCLCMAFGAALVDAQTVGGATKLPGPPARAVRGERCTTPAGWNPKLVSPQLDADANYVEDEIDQTPPLDLVDVILALNECPDASDQARFVASGGTLTYVSQLLSVAHLADVSAGAAVALGADMRVAMVFLDRQLTPFLDKSVAAIRVTTSSEYAGANIEDLVPDLDGEGVNVAVIDTGIDNDHEAFAFTNFTGAIDFSSGSPVFQDPDDEDGHGTHVAAIIAAEGSATGPRGVAPDAGLIDVRVTDASGSASTSTIQQAIDELILKRHEWDIGVLYVGLGCLDCDSAGDDPLSEAANRAVAAGIVVVAPMGNAGLQRVPSPAAGDGVIAVAAMDGMDTVTRTDDAVASLSNYGPRQDDGDGDADDEQKPDCSAPGVAIASAEFDTTDGYVALSGTSMAAAHVAGLAALVRQARPEWGPGEVRDWILSSSEPLTALDWEPTAGHGQIDAYAALLSVKNLELATSGAIAAAGRAFFRVPEDGVVDLNGDGDTSDTVFHFYDAASETLSNLGLAGTLQHSLAEDGELAVLPVSEVQQGNTDLNGDGDTGDSVYYVFDSGALTNLGFDGTDVRIAPGLLAFRASESQNVLDLNGDGDMSDQVVIAYDAVSDVVTNLGLAGLVRVTPTMVAPQVLESSQGNTDLNGDGDTADGVMFVYDAGSSTLTNLGRASTINSFSVSGDVLVFEADEAAQGNTDLNGDGDAADRVLHAHDVSGGTTTNLGLATTEEYWRVAGSVVALEVSEAAQGNTDLNGDGDATDFVIHVRDLAAASAVNLELASLGYSGDPQTDGVETVAFLVSETFQDDTDLNSDDDELDDVLHLYDFQDAINTELAVWPDGPTTTLLIRDLLVAFRVSEFSAAETDLNGDGDTADNVLHIHDLNSGETTNLALAAPGPGVAVHFSYVYESEQGSTDLNGDGDTFDQVLFAYNSRFQTAFNLGLALYNGPITDEPITFVLVDESSQGNTDLNGDGDTLDNVIFVVRKL